MAYGQVIPMSIVRDRTKVVLSIALGKEFVHGRGTMGGSKHEGKVTVESAYLTNNLPEEWEDIWTAANEQGLIDYVVWSYATPIAWHVKAFDKSHKEYLDGRDHWIAPKVKYSTTTSRHQSMVDDALVFAETITTLDGFRNALVGTELDLDDDNG
jgi:hypothetical protein